MKNLLIVLLIFVAATLMGSKVSGAHYDITTVYKFNTDESEENGEVITKYLDTCDVSVHPQTNAIDLPYQRFNNDGQIIYPLQSPTIPTLSAPYDKSEWKTFTSTGDIEPLESTRLLGVGPFTLFKPNNEDIFTCLEHNSVVLYDYGNAIYGLTIADDNVMRNINNQQNIYLLVRVRREYAKDFSFRFVKENGDFIRFEIYQSLNSIKVCPSWYGELCEDYSYEQNEDYQISLYINLVGKLKIYDENSHKVVSLFDSCKNIECFNHIFARIDREYGEGSYIGYKIIQISSLNVLTDGTLFVSPWIHMTDNTSLLVAYYRKLNTSVVPLLKHNYTDVSIQLESEDEDLIKLSPRMDIETDFDEMVLTRVNLRFPPNWSQDKQIQIKANKHVYIDRIWEGGRLEVYQIHQNTTCVKSNVTEMFDVAFRDPRRDIKTYDCLNGGILDMYNETCICPPGFSGDNCEVTCGKNYFGQKCSKFCSDSYTDDECKGMFLCTPSFGCSCATGYRGEKCLQECKEGTYGADCSQSCGQCTGGCDKYTGDCRGECDSPYLVWPSCKHPHSYWTGSPVVVDSSFTSIKLSLNFSSSNVMNSFDKTRFFLIQYKEDTEKSWSNCSFESFFSSITEYSVENLKPGRKYFLRLLLVDSFLNTHDPRLSQISIGLTKCTLFVIDTNMSANKFTNSSVLLSWSGKNSVQNNECPFSSYILLIEGNLKRRKIANIRGNSIMVNFLAPGHIFNITLSKRTVFGETKSISNIIVHTNPPSNSLKGSDITGVTTKLIGFQLHMHWLKSSLYRTYYIKYKLIRRLSCSQDEISPTLQVVSTSSTDYILDLEPYAKYQIFVTGDPTQVSSLHNETRVSYGKLPEAIPTFLRQKLKVTNESVAVFWIDPPTYCYHMHGHFKKYLLYLLDTKNTVLKTYDTKNKNIEINGLIPKTDYKLRISYVNNIGYNPQNYEEQVFSTKATSSLAALDLTAYKTSASLIGLRWKIPDTNSTITGISVSVQNQFGKEIMNITDLTALQCKAWRSYVCYTIQNLKQNTKYTVSVDIYSEEFPEGGSKKILQVVTSEKTPSPVSDIKVENVGSSNMTLSWRIPYLLNGILRKFLIEVEHLSSFDETLCCQSVSTINYVVKEEQESYYHVIDDILNSSSYQVTIRAFTKRLGQEASKVIDIAPPLIPIKYVPQIKINSNDLDWSEKIITNSSSTGIELVTDLLVIVQSNNDSPNYSDSGSQPSLIRTELDRSLKSSSWWIAHVCTTNLDCLVNIGTNEESDSPYGAVKNKPLAVGYNYTIVLAQVNKYLSARSYTIVKSDPFQTNENVATSATPNPESTTLYQSIDLPRVSDKELFSEQESQRNSKASDDITEIIEEDTISPIQDHDTNYDLMEDKAGSSE